MSRRAKFLTERVLTRVAVVAIVAVALLLRLADDARAQTGGNDVAQNIGDLLRSTAAQVWGGIVAVISLVFLINRRFTELAIFCLAAIVVAWLVFSPDQVARAARAIGRQVLG
jgi:site-specific recombinase